MVRRDVRTELDVCLECFKTKVRPAIEALGCELTETEVEV